MTGKNTKLFGKKKTIILIVFLVLVATAFVLGRNSAENNDLSYSEDTTLLFSPASGQIVSVTITDMGFEPKEISIKAGDVVRWTNEDSELHWPASDPHPIHNIVPGFDTKKGLANGESWDFTFLEAGAWDYHDHLSPHKKGRIKVSGSSLESGSESNKISGFFNTFTIWLKGLFEGGQNKSPDLSGLDPSALAYSDEEIERITNLASEEGIAAAYEDMKKVWGTRPVEAHDLTHLIGYLAYQELEAGGFEICDSEFAFGCYHGLLEEMIRQQGEQGIELARQSCNKLSPGGRAASCLHGIGHGVMSWTGGEILEALDICNIFSPNEARYCFDGAYMEFYTGAMFDRVSTINFSADDPWSFCNSQPEFARGECIRNHTFLRLYSAPVEKAFETAESCSDLPDALRAQCLNSVGLFSVQIAFGNVVAPKDICGSLSANDDQALCFMGAAQEFIFQGQSEDKAREMCDGLFDPWEERCDEQIDITISLYR